MNNNNKKKTPNNNRDRAASVVGKFETRAALRRPKMYALRAAYRYVVQGLSERLAGHVPLYAPIRVMFYVRFVPFPNFIISIRRNRASAQSFRD